MPLANHRYNERIQRLLDHNLSLDRRCARLHGEVSDLTNRNRNLKRKLTRQLTITILLAIVIILIKLT